WRVDFDMPTWPADYPVQAIRDALVSPGAAPSHVIDIRRSYTSWGASGATQSVILHVVEGVLTAATGASLKEMIQKLRSRAADGRPAGVVARPLAREEAEYRARWQLAEAFDVGDPDRLVLTGEGRADAKWSFEFECDDWSY